MKIKLLFILFVTAFLFNCESDKPKKDAVDTSQELKSDCKTLLIVAEDRSGSTTNHRKLTAQDYKKIVTQFQEKGNGQIAIRVIGNPVPAEREFFILQVEPQKPFLEIPKDALMSKKGKIRKDNEKIALDNEKIASQNKRTGTNFVASKITQHVLNYKPHKGKDLTNIKNALHHIETKIKEPTFKDYDKIKYNYRVNGYFNLL